MIRLVITSLLVCACNVLQAQTNITTIAGDTVGFYGDNGPASSSLLNVPFCVFQDRHRNLFISDAFNHRIRRIDATTNVITTIAGVATHGALGDNGPASNAELFLPSGIFIDSSDNIYIADAGNNKIRKITASTGIITTVAGNGTMGYTGNNGPATDAQLNAASMICIDKDGNLIIGDLDNNVIRKVNSSTGIITTIAGTGIAGYFGDNGLATNAMLNGAGFVFADADNNILFSDHFNSAVRKINQSTGIITTIAGNGTAGYFGDNVPATDALLNGPGGIFIDGNNDIFIVDYFNGVVRTIDHSTQIITTIAGNGTMGLGGDNGPATDAQISASYAYVDYVGTIYIADENNHRIRRVGGPVGVNEPIQDYERGLFPNPAHDKIYISIKDCQKVIVNDVVGKVVLEQKENSNDPVDVSTLNDGIYIAQITDSKGRKFTTKFVKQ